jgi:hypothetical protein
VETPLEFVSDALNVVVRILQILYLALCVGRDSLGLKNRSKEPNVNPGLVAVLMNWRPLSVPFAVEK